VNHRNLSELLSTTTTVDLMNELHEMVEGASIIEKDELAQSALSQCIIRRTANFSVNGWLLYLFCLGNEQVSLALLRKNCHRLHCVVFPRWASGLRKLRTPRADDASVRTLALHMYTELKKLA
jgi:hypothetical protein